MNEEALRVLIRQAVARQLTPETPATTWPAVNEPVTSPRGAARSSASISASSESCVRPIDFS